MENSEPRHTQAVADLLRTVALTDSEARIGEQWAAREQPVTRPFLRAIADRWQERSRTGELDLKYRSQPDAKQKVNQLDQLQVGLPAGILVGVQIGIAGHPGGEALLAWGAWAWGVAAQMEAMRPQFEKLRRHI